MTNFANDTITLIGADAVNAGDVRTQDVAVEGSMSNATIATIAYLRFAAMPLEVASPTRARRVMSTGS